MQLFENEVCLFWFSILFFIIIFLIFWSAFQIVGTANITKLLIVPSASAKPMDSKSTIDLEKNTSLPCLRHAAQRRSNLPHLTPLWTIHWVNGSLRHSIVVHYVSSTAVSVLCRGGQRRLRKKVMSLFPCVLNAGWFHWIVIFTIPLTWLNVYPIRIKLAQCLAWKKYCGWNALCLALTAPQ